MPLRDHFRPPVSNLRHWSGAFGGWPAEICRQLFDLLPDGFRSAPRIRLTAEECDVVIGGGFALTLDFPPPLSVEADLGDQDEYEVRVYDEFHQLVAAVVLVSPSAKERPMTRSQLVGKVASLLRQGVCVSVVDIVTVPEANLYVDLLAGIGRADPRLSDPPPALYAVTLRRRKPKKKPPVLDLWYFPLAIGQPLPTLPLWLSPDLRIDLSLEPSYQEVCRLLRIP